MNIKYLRYLFIIIALGLFFSSNSCQKKEPLVFNPATAEDGNVTIKDENGPKIKFESTKYDFGTVIQGERITHTFVFTNTGKSDLIISSAAPSCGCTTSAPPKGPIKPGEKGELKVTFDSKTKKGKVSNTVTVAANTYPTRTILILTANVKEP